MKGKSKRLYNVIFVDNTACSIEAYNKSEAKEAAAKTKNKQVKSVVRCYKRKEIRNDN